MNRIIEEGTAAAVRGTALALALGSGLLLDAATRIAGETQPGTGTPDAPRGPEITDPWSWLRFRPEATTGAQAAGPMDSGELEGFIDRFFAAEGVGTVIPRAAFVLVKSGRIFFQKGYGCADPLTMDPVAPEKTLFRTASNTNVLTATAAEMGRFLLAILGGSLGRGLGDGRSCAVRRLYRQHFARYPGCQDAVYGFFEGMANNHRTLFHTGDSSDRSLLYLLPDQGMGFYAVVGGADEKAAFRFRTRLVQKFLDRYYPAGDEEGAAQVGTSASVAPGR
ncbi:MAG: serine hydrolase [Chloroflexi bacterium]|nr:serine hydrolase [Chloroflexota bacterium]